MGKRQASALVLLDQMGCYLQLMIYAPNDWFEVVAMRAEGIGSSWVNALL